MIKSYIVAFWTLFSAVLIGVMVLTALAGTSGAVLSDHRPAPQALAQAAPSHEPLRNPEREARKEIGKEKGSAPGRVERG